MANLKAREGHEAEVRREGVERLAAAVRRARRRGDGHRASTGRRWTRSPARCELITHRLRTETDDDPYSGLVIKPVDYTIPEGPMPLNPIVGACSPVRPDVRLRFRDGEVVGTRPFTKRFVGPPGFAHGGISAMLADQIVAVSPMAVGVRAITKSLELQYLRPLPLDEESSSGACACRPATAIRARFTIRVRGKVAVEGTAELVSFESTYERFVKREVRRAPPSSGVRKPVGR